MSDINNTLATNATDATLTTDATMGILTLHSLQNTTGNATGATRCSVRLKLCFLNEINMLS
jgi:hypothetical protein